MYNYFADKEFFLRFIKDLIQYGQMTMPYDRFLPEGYELPFAVDGITVICEKPTGDKRFDLYYIHKNDRKKAMENFFRMIRLPVIVREINFGHKLGLQVLWAQH